MSKALFVEDADAYRSKHSKPLQYVSEEVQIMSDLRRKLVMNSRCNYQAFIDCIKENEELFRYHLTEDDKESLRCICQDAKSKFGAFARKSDNELFDRVFGYYLPDSIPYNDGKQRIPRIKREMEYFAKATYESFYGWLSNPDTQSRIAMYPEYNERLKDIIDIQKETNKRISDKHKGYEVTDEELFEKVTAWQN